MHDIHNGPNNIIQKKHEMSGVHASPLMNTKKDEDMKHLVTQQLVTPQLINWKKPKVHQLKNLPGKTLNSESENESRFPCSV